jgi:AmmeMemoRadiSam system protein B
MQRATSNVRDPYVAGYFYPGQEDDLGRTVRSLLREAPRIEGPAPKALIVPHAGYVYSGPVAATAYACLQAHHRRYSRVVLLGPCHRIPARGLATSGCDAFRTPLGDVPLDKAAIAQLENAGVASFEAMHNFEHSLEVQLPFLQAVLDDFAIVPIVAGDAPPDAVAGVLDILWGGPETLIVVSSDLSHYLPFEEARSVDAATCSAIERFEVRHIRHSNACGATGVSGLLIAARRHGLGVKTVDLRNSGDTGGDKASVVGYGAWVFGEKPDQAVTG